MPVDTRTPSGNSATLTRHELSAPEVIALATPIIEEHRAKTTKKILESHDRYSNWLNNFATTSPRDRLVPPSWPGALFKPTRQRGEVVLRDLPLHVFSPPYFGANPSSPSVVTSPSMGVIQAASADAKTGSMHLFGVTYGGDPEAGAIAVGERTIRTASAFFVVGKFTIPPLSDPTLKARIQVFQSAEGNAAVYPRLTKETGFISLRYSVTTLLLDPTLENVQSSKSKAVEVWQMKETTPAHNDSRTIQSTKVVEMDGISISSGATLWVFVGADLILDEANYGGILIADAGDFESEWLGPGHLSVARVELRV